MILQRQRAFGYTLEDQRILLGPMAAAGQEPIGSMGVDTPLACLSDRPQLLFNYFKQLFAQVTNPPIDPIREELVMSTICYVGTEGNLLDETQAHAHVMKLDMPNPHAIFLHDTPSRGLFAQENRALSHGCVRVERALELAMTIAILGQGATRDEAVAISTSGQYTRVPVKKSMPVYITYFTVKVNADGSVSTYGELYGHDARMAAALRL